MPVMGSVAWPHYVFVMIGASSRDDVRPTMMILRKQEGRHTKSARTSQDITCCQTIVPECWKVPTGVWIRWCRWPSQRSWCAHGGFTLASPHLVIRWQTFPITRVLSYKCDLDTLWCTSIPAPPLGSQMRARSAGACVLGHRHRWHHENMSSSTQRFPEKRNIHLIFSTVKQHISKTIATIKKL